jgi:hypothetical protein
VATRPPQVVPRQFMRRSREGVVMPAMPNRDDALRALGTKTVQSVATASATLRRALARLVTSSGNQRGAGRRTR